MAKRKQEQKDRTQGRVILNCYSREEALVRTSPHVKNFFEKACPEGRQLIAVYDFERSILTTLGGYLTEPSKANHQKMIFQFLASNKELFGVANPEKQLQFIPDRSHLETPQKAYKFIQVFEEIPVYGGSVSVTIDEQGRIRSIANNFKPSIYQKSFPPQVNLQPKEVKEIVTKDLKMVPIEKTQEGKSNKSLEEKMKRIIPSLVWVPNDKGWRLVYRYLIAVWEVDSDAKGEPKRMRPAAYEYWIDAGDGRIVAKQDAAQYCDNSVGLVETPVSQLTWNDRGRVPFNTCEGWKWKITREGMRRITYYLEDHTHSGIIETYDVSDVSGALIKRGYNSVFLPGGWPANTPTDENDIWEDHGASNVATVHWAAQRFRDFLKEEFGRDQILSDNDIDIGANFSTTPMISYSFAISSIDTLVITDTHSGIAVVAHELMHMITYNETPGVSIFTGLFDDQSVDEFISDLFQVFTQFRKSPYRTLRARPWCHQLDTRSSIALLAARGRPQFELFRRGQPFDYFGAEFCGDSAPIPKISCWHKSHEGLPTMPCEPGKFLSNYYRAGISLRAGLLLAEGGNLYRDFGWPRVAFTGQRPAHTTPETDFDAQLIVYPIGMEKLMQISYKTVIEKLDSGMRYEDWAARQIASATELGYDYNVRCNVEKAHAAVGYGESTDWDCDGIDNDHDTSGIDLLFHPSKDQYYVDELPSREGEEELYQIQTYLLKSPGELMEGIPVSENQLHLHIWNPDGENRLPCVFLPSYITNRRLICDISKAQVSHDVQLVIRFAGGGTEGARTNSPVFTGREIIEMAR